MAEEARRLAAIMLTDIVGYTALAQKDEPLALELLGEHNRLLRPLFRGYAGREIKSTGDGFLVEFPSALEATRCAIEIQTALKDRNAAASPERRIEVRIGLHVGDVLHREGDVFGDGVNIAARIEPLAPPGGICLTRQAYDHVWNKLDRPLVSLGKRELKNIQLPMEVYRVVLPWEEPPEGGRHDHDRSRIAVLPLANISPDPKDEYFADGMTEELIYTLSKLRELRVIAYTSVMAYKGQRKKIAEIGRELGVGTVLEGSVRKAGNRLRITALLIDAQNEEHLWSERYDRDLEDVFAIQSDIAKRVAEALQVHLLAGERQEIEKEPTGNLEAYDLYLRGRHCGNERTEERFKKAIECFEGAIGIDPDYALAYAGLADIYTVLPLYAPAAFKETFLRAKRAALQALLLDDTLAEARVSLAQVKAYCDWNWAEAEREFIRAIALKPSYATAHYQYGRFFIYMGRFDEALEEIHRALELDPLSVLSNFHLGVVVYLTGDYDEAIKALQKTIEMAPNFWMGHIWLGMAYLEKSMYAEALARLHQAKALPGCWPSMADAVIASVYTRMGKRRAARELLDELLRRSEREYIPPSWMAILYSALGENDRCFAWLEQAYEEHDQFLLFLAKGGGIFEIDRADPRFTALLKRIGLKG
ncbi:MAG: tetratricopeptide repeat protein [Candidatus Acetothermia bacterium]|jgi:TolB-like protein/Tfp pilus assembly protein PilF|nr:tetratricopeptide repeat protein [Candidatus Acetothermia bacterium]MDH7505497.1 tetratricopeptide repeat protein [Candidatus Acetothermia bacterium]